MKKFILRSAIVPVLALLPLVSGCVNPYMTSYANRALPPRVANRILPLTDQPLVESSNDLKKDGHQLLEEGYVLIGKSQFEAESANENAALQQAQTIGAWVVLVNHQYSRTDSRQVPVYKNLPDQSVTFTTQQLVPGSDLNNPQYENVDNVITTPGGTETDWDTQTFDLYNYSATYWARAKTPLIGVMVHTPPADPTAPNAPPRGLAVRVVVQASPAEAAGVQEGDVLLTLAGEGLVSGDQLFDVVTRHAGKVVTLKLSRGGNTMQLKIHLNKDE